MAGLEQLRQSLFWKHWFVALRRCATPEARNAEEIAAGEIKLGLALTRISMPDVRSTSPPRGETDVNHEEFAVTAVTRFSAHDLRHDNPIKHALAFTHRIDGRSDEDDGAGDDEAVRADRRLRRACTYSVRDLEPSHANRCVMTLMGGLSEKA